jgi:hypothetical protein
MIYFVQGVITQRIKIGYARHPKKRVGSLQSESPDELKLLGQMHGEMEDETALHEQFMQYRLHGEWFKPDILPQVLEILHKDAADPRPPKLNVIVSGDSDFRDQAIVWQALDELHARDAKRPISWLILGGGTRPVEGATWVWANQHKVRVYGYHLKWAKYGMGAGSKVNKQLIGALFDTKLLLVFCAAKASPTTNDLIRRATKARIEIVRKQIEEPRPVMPMQVPS